MENRLGPLTPSPAPLPAHPVQPAELTPFNTMVALNPNAVFPTHNPSSQFKFSAEEELVLQYWKDIDAFQESIRQSEGKPQYSFYDGPPFATGLPHHGHILMGTVKVSRGSCAELGEQSGGLG